MDRATARKMFTEIEAVMQKYAGKNFTVQLDSRRYGTDTLSTKLVLKEGSAADTVANLAKSWNLVTERNGFKLKGFSRSAKKFPFLYEKDGKVFKTDFTHIKLYLGIAAK